VIAGLVAGTRRVVAFLSQSIAGTTDRTESSGDWGRRSSACRGRRVKNHLLTIALPRGGCYAPSPRCLRTQAGPQGPSGRRPHLGCGEFPAAGLALSSAQTDGRTDLRWLNGAGRPGHLASDVLMSARLHVYRATRSGGRPAARMLRRHRCVGAGPACLASATKYPRCAAEHLSGGGRTGRRDSTCKAPVRASRPLPARVLLCGLRGNGRGPSRRTA